MSGWSTTYRWGGYMRGDARGIVNHDLRAPGVQQSNAMVDPARTKFNVVQVTDGRGGLRDLRPGEHGVSTVMDHLDTIIAGAKKNTRQHKVMKRNTTTGKNEWTGEIVEKEIALRKDASVMVEVILQLDGEYTGTGAVVDERGRPVWVVDDDGEPVVDEEGHKVPLIRTCADMRVDELEDASRLLDVMVDEVKEQHPTCEMLFVTKHFDETHPHVQMGFVPLTQDGRIHQKSVMGAASHSEAQKKYSDKHDRMRMALIDRGYEATFERVDDGKRHVGLAEFKREKDRERQQAEKSQEALDLVNQQHAENAKAAAALHSEKVDLNDIAKSIYLDKQAVEKEKADLPEMRRRAKRQGYQDGRKEAEKSLAEERRTAREAAQAAEQERARLAELAAQRPLMPSFDEVLKTQSSMPRRFMKRMQLPDGTTMLDQYTEWAKQEYSRTLTTEPYDQWLAKAESATVGEAKRRYVARVAELEQRFGERNRPGDPDGEYGDS